MGKETNMEITYLGYTAKILWDEEESCYRGKVINIKNDKIAFKTDVLEDIEDSFQDAVDEYLEFCEEYDYVPCSPDD